MPLVNRNRRPQVGTFSVAPWRTKKRALGEHAGPAPDDLQGDPGPPGSEESEPDDLRPLALRRPDDADDRDARPPPARWSADQTSDLDGTANIAWLPSGHFSGHFVDGASSRCIGIHGREVLQVQECTRDDERALLLLILTDFRTSGALSVAVERSGGDAACLSSLEPGSGWESDAVERLEGLCEGVRLSFACDVIKSDSEAQRYVRRFLPALHGREGVIVTQGAMQLHGVPVPIPASPGQAGTWEQGQEQEQEDPGDWDSDGF